MQKGEKPPEYRSPRPHYEPPPSSGRTEGERDRDRVLYSSALNRLAGVTQVASSPSGILVHNRLTHSFKVAQVARRLAERLKRDEGDVPLVERVDVDATEAAALAHDLGHPPFGHITEEILADQMREAGGFEGNAQSFRIVNRLAVRDSEYSGLNLMPVTLNGMLKYPWLPGERPGDPTSKKFGAYWSDRDSFRNAQAQSTVRPGVRTLEAELMDFADDVTYAVHDLEDFYRVGLIPLDRLRTDRDEREQFFESFSTPEGQLKPKFEDADPDQLRQRIDLLFQGKLIFDAFVGTTTQRAQLRQAMSMLIGEFMNGISARVSDESNERVVALDRDVYADILILKELTWFYVIDRPALAVIQEAQRRMVASLFELYAAAAEPNGRRELLPLQVQTSVFEAPSPEVRLRIVSDFLAGLTEARVIELHRLVTGAQQGDILRIAM
jgi:dGTPase